MSDVLKRPVHAVLLKETLLQRLSKEGRLTKTEASLDTPEAPKLPSEASQAPKKVFVPPLPDVLSQGRKQRQQENVRLKLRVLHESIPPIPPDKQPPCGTCKAAPCCKAFVVQITEQEYESGLYGEYAVKITPEAVQQLSTQMLSILSTGSFLNGIEGNQYLLEGKVGEACPFLQPDNRCGIYDNRPITCRTYTCVGDERITQEMRDGTVDALTGLIKRALRK